MNTSPAVQNWTKTGHLALALYFHTGEQKQEQFGVGMLLQLESQAQNGTERKLMKKFA